MNFFKNYLFKNYWFATGSPTFLVNCLKILLSSIPYNIQIENREAYYHSLIYIALRLSMLDVQCEIQTAIGRSDIVVMADRYIYVIELKMGVQRRRWIRLRKRNIIIHTWIITRK
ncbi:MAG: PD-(D/E)XK nuclease domain-containing protein [Candidatus Omnitrophota bacterium]